MRETRIDGGDETTGPDPRAVADAEESFPGPFPEWWQAPRGEAVVTGQPSVDESSLKERCTPDLRFGQFGRLQ